MNARVAPPLMLADLTVPRDDVRWCAMLGEALSVCCISPGPVRIAEVHALLAMPPVAMLSNSWADLVDAGRAWLVANEAAAEPGRFMGARLIEAALRDKPVSVPTWAERFR